MSFGLALVLALAGAPQDTVVAVARGDALVIETHAGSVVVRVSEGAEVRLEGSGALSREGRVVRYDDPGERRRRDELTLFVPAWLDVNVEGRQVDIEVVGTRGRTRLRTLSGDIRVRDTAGDVAVRTVSGEIEARAVDGRTELWTADGDIDVRGARGRLSVQSTSGDLFLAGVDADDVSAEATDGDIVFDGVVPSGARIRLATHDGDIVAVVPADVQADVRVSTFDGSFRPAIPVRARGFRAGEELRFTLGRGGAELSLEAFDGDIELRHPPGG